MTYIFIQGVKEFAKDKWECCMWVATPCCLSFCQGLFLLSIQTVFLEIKYLLLCENNIVRIVRILFPEKA